MPALFVLFQVSFREQTIIIIIIIPLFLAYLISHPAKLLLLLTLMALYAASLQ